MKLIFVRHGQTNWNAEDRIQGHLDAELSDLGLRQAQVVADALAEIRVDAVYSSDLQRASVTAEIIAEKHGLAVIQTPLLQEVCLGEWQGMTISEVKDRFPEQYAAYRADSTRNRPPGAERIEDVIERSRCFVEMVLPKYPEGNIIVTAHGGTIRGAVCCVLGQGPALFRKVRLENAGITTLGFWVNDLPHIYLLNEICHLRGLEDTENMQEM
jgi:phosphoserine phosphatase